MGILPLAAGPSDNFFYGVACQDGWEESMIHLPLIFNHGRRGKLLVAGGKIRVKNDWRELLRECQARINPEAIYNHQRKP